MLFISTLQHLKYINTTVMHLINILVQTDGLGSSALSTLERVPNVSSPLSLLILLSENRRRNKYISHMMIMNTRHSYLKAWDTMRDLLHTGMMTYFILRLNTILTDEDLFQTKTYHYSDINSLHSNVPCQTQSEETCLRLKIWLNKLWLSYKHQCDASIKKRWSEVYNLDVSCL